MDIDSTSPSKDWRLMREDETFLIGSRCRSLLKIKLSRLKVLETHQGEPDAHDHVGVRKGITNSIKGSPSGCPAWAAQSLRQLWNSPTSIPSSGKLFQHLPKCHVKTIYLHSKSLHYNWLFRDSCTKEFCSCTTWYSFPQSSSVVAT